MESFIPVRGSKVEANIRATEEYKDKCCEAVGLGDKIDVKRYEHLVREGSRSLNESKRREEAVKGKGEVVPENQAVPQDSAVPENKTAPHRLQDANREMQEAGLGRDREAALLSELKDSDDIALLR